MRHTKLASLALAGTSFLALACAHGSTSRSRADKERVTVTGSRIPPNLANEDSCFPDTASPVTVYPREALQAGIQGNLYYSLAHANPATPCSRTDREGAKSPDRPEGK